MDHGGDDMYQRQKSAPGLTHTALSLSGADAFSAVVGHTQTVFLLSRGRYLNVLVETPDPPTSASVAERLASDALITIG
jgi:hypothetical protein